MTHRSIGHLPASQFVKNQEGVGVPPHELVYSMRCVWEASNAGAVWGKYARSNPNDSDMTIRYAHLVVSCYVETFQVNKKVLFPDSPTLFRTFNYPRYSNNKRLRVAHKSGQKSIRRKTSSISTYTNLYFVKVLIKPFLYTMCVHDSPARPIILCFRFSQ
jgi:hypothetical protein